MLRLRWLGFVCVAACGGSTASTFGVDGAADSPEEVTESSSFLTPDTSSPPPGDASLDTPVAQDAGHFDCASKGPCPNDPTPTQSEIDACNQALGGACGAEYNAFGDCAYAAAKCTAAGVTDSAAAIAACQSQYNAYVSCATGGPG
jgi:hypothetical protein